MRAIIRLTSSKLHHQSRFTTVRTILNVRIKWVKDPFLDAVVSRELNLKPVLSLHSLLAKSPCKTLTLSAASLLRPKLGQDFIQKHPSFFTIFKPEPPLPPRVRLTRRAISIFSEESDTRTSAPVSLDTAERLAKVLLICRRGRAPIRVIGTLAWDLGLSEDFASSLVSDYPDLFSVCEIGDYGELGIEVVPSETTNRLTRETELQRRSVSKAVFLPGNLPRGFDLPKQAVERLREWERSPYVSAYENGLVLGVASDHAEKWIVAAIHELLWLTVSKKAEREGIFALFDWIGFDRYMVKRALRRHPQIFYLSNKISTKTMVLREAYHKDMLIHKHPIMSLRHQYIALLNSRPPCI